MSIGNPAIWWLGFLALAVVIYGALRRLDWRAWLILAGYLGLYVPWFQYTERTIFTFYTVVFVPFVVFALLYAIWLPGHVLQMRQLADDAAAAELAYEAADREAAALASQSEAGADGAGGGVGAAGAGDAAGAAGDGKGTGAAGAAGAGGAGGGVGADGADMGAGAAARGASAPVTTEAAAGSTTWGEALERVKASLLGTDRRTLVALGAVTALVLALAVYFWPIYVGDYIPHHEWHERMWFQSWI